ncbi:MAG: alkaline phosphatase family protein [Spirochaetes bacterium]|nr:alkaline phosphatase family protein [Spirochaetota bacterium]
MRLVFRIGILLVLMISAQAFGWNTSHVVIMIMDGARYCETWGDAAHTNIPKIAALASQATVLTQFRTALPGSAAIDWSETCPGHARITTGTVQNIANDGTQLPSMPSMFQQYRKQTGAASNAAWVITSKDKLFVLANSSAGGWNNAYQPSINCGVNGNGTGGYREDSVTHPIVKQKLTNDRPALMIINYKGPDSMGHANNWNGYIAAIRAVDGYADDLWTTIQSDAQLKDKTALIILNDHGRHTSNFVSHGDSCDGCTHIMFVALGPDFKKNYVTGTVSREHIDIAPTVAQLLGITMSNAAGNRMSELLLVTPVVSGAPAGITTNKSFNVTLDVDTNFGYWSTNGSAFAQFTMSGVTISIDRTTTLRYFGSNTGISATNSITYTFDTAAPVVSGAPANLTTNTTFTVTLDVNENYGWFSTNGTTYYQFTTAATNIIIDRTLTLYYYGRDTLGNNSSTNTRIYTMDIPPVVSGAPASLTTNKTFIIPLDVDKNYGYWSTNNSPFAQLTTSGVNITVDRTTTLRYFGSNAAGIGSTNTRTYTFDTTAPSVTGVPNDMSTNKEFTITLSVNENYGYVSLNGGAYVQFTTAGTNISINRTASLSCCGRDALGNSSATNTRTYTVNIINGLENPSAVGGSDGFTIMNIPEHTTGAVYTISGRFVASLAAHDHGLFWDIRTTDGKRAAPGVYLCRLSSASDRKIVKIMVQR